MKQIANKKKESLLSKDDRKASQGFVDIKTKTVEQLEELIERQEKLLQNRSFIGKLPDKGEKIISFKATLEAELEKRRQEYNSTCHLLSKLTLNDATPEDIEWHNGKLESDNEKLDSDDESDSDSELNPLKLIASHSGTAKGKKTKIKSDDSSTELRKNLYVDKFCERYGEVKTQKERFKPNQLKDNDKTLFAISAEKVKQRLGDKWEVTQATPPVPVFKDTVFISLSESLKLQKEQSERLKEIEKQQATERLMRSLSLKMGDKLPVNNITEYRNVENPFDETVRDSEEENHDLEEEEEEAKEKTVLFSVEDAN